MYFTKYNYDISYINIIKFYFRIFLFFSNINDKLCNTKNDFNYKRYSRNKRIIK